MLLVRALRDRRRVRAAGMVNVSIFETRAGRSQRETAAINLLTSGRDIRSFQGNAALRTDPANEPSFEHSISDPVWVLPRASRLFRIRNVLLSRETFGRGHGPRPDAGIRRCNHFPLFCNLKGIKIKI